MAEHFLRAALLGKDRTTYRRDLGGVVTVPTRHSFDARGGHVGCYGLALTK